jgi:proline iminopeptidase
VRGETDCVKIAAQGAELHCTVRGEGPVCLVLSAMGTKPYERMMPAQLSERMRLVFVDPRGGGQSTGEAADLTFEVLAQDLDAIRSAMGAARVAVLGHSILGVLAIEYARRRPQSVSHVITVGTPPRGDMAWLAAKAAEFFEQDATEDRKCVLRENLEALGPDAPPGLAFIARTPTRFFDARADISSLFEGAEGMPALLGHLMGELTRGWDVTRDASSLRVPILLAHGRYDYTVPWVLWDGVAEKLPAATRRIFERSGHLPFYEEPKQFAKAVMDWIEI